MGRGTPFDVPLSTDDWFFERVRLDYNNENLAEIPHQEYLRRMEGRIVMVVSSTQDGISHLELARKVGINRKNLTPHMKRLKMKGLIIRARGKQGKYHPANRKHRGVSITADIFSKLAAYSIFNIEKDFPIDSPYIEDNLIEVDSLENALFKFSNGVGAIITYLLIQAMNLSNDIPGRDAINPEEQDINVNRWVSDGISTLGTHLLALFKQYIAGDLVGSCGNYVDKDGTIDFKRSREDLMRHMYRRPLFTLDEKSINCLVNGFCGIYPGIGVHLEKIRSYLPSIVNREESRYQYHRIRSKQQKICNHKYKLIEHTTTFNGHSLSHCTKCHKTKSLVFG